MSQKHAEIVLLYRVPKISPGPAAHRVLPTVNSRGKVAGSEMPSSWWEKLMLLWDSGPPASPTEMNEQGGGDQNRRGGLMGMKLGLR